jgi:hypothetical protein
MHLPSLPPPPGCGRGGCRSFLGHGGVKFTRRVLPVMMRCLCATIPEDKMFLDLDLMVREALTFDYSGIDVAITERAWIPTYCQV